MPRQWQWPVQLCLTRHSGAAECGPNGAQFLSIQLAAAVLGKDRCGRDSFAASWPCRDGLGVLTKLLEAYAVFVPVKEIDPQCSVVPRPSNPLLCCLLLSTLMGRWQSGAKVLRCRLCRCQSCIR